MSSNQLVRRDGRGAALSRGVRRDVEAFDAGAAVAHHELQVRLEYAQVGILADTALANTAMAAIAGSGAFARTLCEVCPEDAEALRLLQAKHLGMVGARMDGFAGS
jgi:hypothetical protein